MQTYKQKVGAFGEKIAIDFLKKQGYQIRETNLKLRYQELDIVAFDGDDLVFVEVKTRTNTFWGEPEDALGYQKFNNIKKSIGMYLKYFQFDEKINSQVYFRFDLIAIVIDKNRKTAKIRHYKELL